MPNTTRISGRRAVRRAHRFPGAPVRSALLAAVLASSFPGTGTAQGSARGSLEVTADGDRLSIAARDASAADIAAAIAAATGISVVVTGEPDTSLSADIVDAPLARAIAGIAPNNLLVRQSADADSRIVEIVLMMPDSEDGGVESAEFLPSGEPADEIFDDTGLASQGGFDENDAAGEEPAGGVDPSLLRDPNRRSESMQADDGTVADDGFGDASEFDPAMDPSMDPAMDPSPDFGFDGQP